MLQRDEDLYEPFGFDEVIDDLNLVGFMQIKKV